MLSVELAFGSLKLLPGASARETIEETEEMLICIVVRVLRVKSHAHWILDGSPSCEGNARHTASRRWKTDLKFEIR